MVTTIRNILITGPPGVGKTTLITSVALRLASLHPVGFYTREIREQGTRRGFEAVSLAGRRAILAHVDHQSPHRVGRYGVDIPAFDTFLASLNLSPDFDSPVVFDEIGKMECFSSRFRNLVTSLLDSPVPLLTSVALRGGGLIAAVKERPDIRLMEVTPKNRNNLIPELVALIASLSRRP